MNLKILKIINKIQIAMKIRNSKYYNHVINEIENDLRVTFPCQAHSGALISSVNKNILFLIKKALWG